MAKAGNLVDGDVFVLDGKIHVVAVNMTTTGAMACYLRPEKKRTDRSATYRVWVEADAEVAVA